MIDPYQSLSDRKIIIFADKKASLKSEMSGVDIFDPNISRLVFVFPFR